MIKLAMRPPTTTTRRPHAQLLMLRLRPVSRSLIRNQTKRGPQSMALLTSLPPLVPTYLPAYQPNQPEEGRKGIINSHLTHMLPTGLPGQLSLSLSLFLPSSPLPLPLQDKLFWSQKPAPSFSASEHRPSKWSCGCRHSGTWIVHNHQRFPQSPIHSISLSLRNMTTDAFCLQGLCTTAVSSPSQMAWIWLDSSTSRL